MRDQYVQTHSAKDCLLMCGIVDSNALELSNMPTKQPESEAVVKSPIKIAVYTCITQGYDSLKIPLSTDKRLAYFCFTDTRDSVMPPWEFRPIDLKGLSPKDQNRYIKMHPHEVLPGYDVTVYVDGNIQIVGNLYELICTLLNAPEDIFFYQHPNRNCVYAEGAACSHIAHERIWNIVAQMRRYNKAGYPVKNGLFEANVIIRKNTSRMCRFMDEWWREYRTGAKRDQLSLPFVSWMLGIPLGSLGESDPRFRNINFRRFTHPPRLSLNLIILKAINRSIAAIVTYKRLFGLASPVLWDNEIKERYQ